jgi:DNA-binding NtrC family response regulator
MAILAGRILVVDDSLDMRTLVRDILVPPHDVVVASDGNIAYFTLETAPFDVVLTDVRMPGIDGFELARLIKTRWPLTEVVFMTAYASISGAVEAGRLGASDFIAKPFDPDDLRLVVARAVERGRERARTEGSAATQEHLTAFSYREALAEARERGAREYLAALLRSCAGNVSRAAERAGLERESLHRLLRRHGLQAESFRDSSSRR